MTHPHPGSVKSSGHGSAKGRPDDDTPALRLVAWETTRNCNLACVHCRASATPSALPGELTGDEGRALIDQVAGFGQFFAASRCHL